MSKRLNLIYIQADDEDVEEQSKDEELEKSRPEVSGEEGPFGDMPNPEEVQEKTVLEIAQEMGSFTDADEEHPKELGTEYDNKNS